MSCTTHALGPCKGLTPLEDELYVGLDILQFRVTPNGYLPFWIGQSEGNSGVRTAIKRACS